MSVLQQSLLNMQHKICSGKKFTYTRKIMPNNELNQKCHFSKIKYSGKTDELN